MNIFQRLFGRPPQTVERAELLSGNTGQFTAWSGDAYSSDVYRGAVDAIARNAAKLKAAHVVRTPEGIVSNSDGPLNRLLQTQPNPYMNAYDTLYKLITWLFLYNNSFAYLQRDDNGNIAGIYPIMGANVEFVTNPAGALFCRFLFRSGSTAILPYADIVHLRRHFNDNDLLGSPNDAILPALELAHTQSEGLTTAIKSGAHIRGILSFTQLLSPEKLKAERDHFIKDYLSITNDGGVIATDQKMDYKPIDLNPVVIDDKQLSAIQTKIYNYLGVSETIVNSTYDEDTWAAFYESTIEPIALQLSLEFTRKIFTKREQAFGNSILFESGRLQFSSNKTKIELIAQLMPYGMLTINQALEVLNLPAIADGDRRLQTLNVIDAAAARNYQLKRTLQHAAINEMTGGNEDES